MLNVLGSSEISCSFLYGISCYCMNETCRKHALSLGTFRKGTEARESTCFQDSDIVTRLEDWFEYILSETAIIKLSYLGSQQPHFLVLGHCAEPALGDTPGIPTEYEGSTQPRKREKCSAVEEGMLFVSWFWSVEIQKDIWKMKKEDRT